MSQFNDLLLGGHMPTSGGVSLASDWASRFGFRTFQLFSKNQRQWNQKPLDPDEVKAFRKKTSENSQVRIMVHGSYLLNMGTSDPELRSNVLNAFRDEISRSDQLGVDYLVFHPGSRGKSTAQEGLTNVAVNLNEVISREQKVMILMETAAGQGGSIGHTFEQLGSIIDMVEAKEKVGICFDTCHVWAAGYDIRSPKGYESVMADFDGAIGLQKLKGFHLNDSKKERGSHVDRHEQIGKGTLGTEGVANFVNDPRLRGLPMNFETPLGVEGYEQDVSAVKSVLEKS
jgi:deoxyribonuclease-4